MTPTRHAKAPPPAPAPTNNDRLAAYTVELDATARAMETKWGVGRLPMLVSAETLLKFKAANTMLADTISANDAARMPKVVAMMIRAWGALETEATVRGHQPLAPTVWEAPMADGRVLVLVRTNAEAHAVTNDRRGVLCFTVEEIARLMPKFEMLTEIKLEFPGAVVVAGPRKGESFANDFATSDEFMPWAHGEAA